MNESRHTYESVTAHIQVVYMYVNISMSHDTHMNESRHTYESVTAHIQVRYKCCAANCEVNSPS